MFVLNTFDEFCHIRCLCVMSYVAMSFGQMSFVVVSYGQDEFYFIYFILFYPMPDGIWLVPL